MQCTKCIIYNNTRYYCIYEYQHKGKHHYEIDTDYYDVTNDNEDEI